MKIAGAALNQTPLDWENNVRNIITAIKQAQSQNVQLLCLPELCLTGYGCEDVFLSPWLHKKALDKLFEILPYCSNITVSIGLPVSFNGNLYNTACLVKDKKILGFTAKQFLANDGVHYEHRWFTPWKADLIDLLTITNKRSGSSNNSKYKFGDVIYDTGETKIGFEICEDALHENRPCIRHSKKNVNLILNPSASPFTIGKSQKREELVTNSSKKFNCTYMYANLLGNEAGRLIFDGEILIAQNGKLLQRNKKLSFEDVNLVTAEINFKAPLITGLKTANHKKETEFLNAATLGLFDYLRKSKSKGFVISLSGGADSSTCAVLVAEMVKRAIDELGIEEFIKKLNIKNPKFEIRNSKLETRNSKLEIRNSKSEITNHESLSLNEKINHIISSILTCVYQGTKNSSKETYKSAQALADSISAAFYHWNIDEEIDLFTKKIESAIGRKFDWKNDDITLQNIQARTRSPLMWMMANAKNALLIVTSNRSEGDVGYATMDGDTSGSLAPIAGIDKVFIRQWLQWAERTLGYKALKNVNALTPSAELRPGEKSQTDEADLMPYPILTAIEKAAIGNRLSPVEVYDQLKGLEDDSLLKKHIRKFFTLWAKNQWKRERMAPSFYLDELNIDPRSWCRFPILSGGFEKELMELENL
ncbi:MAG: NAD(+) synthase [Bacteroidetes bacterium]|nr:NAD(+) synthase [Bacteroidota bacterium]